MATCTSTCACGTPVYNYSSSCTSCGCTVTNSCDPCNTTLSATPMVQCATVDLCSDGCLETISSGCVIYKGVPLPVIEAIEGDTLSSVLIKIDALLYLLSEFDVSIPNYNYRLPCLISDAVPVVITSILKNGAQQILGSQLFPNAPSALAYLQTLDAGWGYTAPNLFSIHSADIWVLSMACPA